MAEMFPRQDYLQPQKQSAFFQKAKMSLSGEKKIEPFNFLPEVRRLPFLCAHADLRPTIVLREAEQHRGRAAAARQHVRADRGGQEDGGARARCAAYA